MRERSYTLVGRDQFQTRFNIPIIGEFYAATEGNATLFNRVEQDGVGRGAIGRMGFLLRCGSWQRSCRTNYGQNLIRWTSPVAVGTHEQSGSSGAHRQV